MAYSIYGCTWTEDDKKRHPEVLMSHPWTPLDGNKRHLQLINASQDEGKLIIGGDTSAGRAIKDTNVPTRLAWTGPSLEELPLLDIISFYRGNLLACSSLRDLLEEMEPGVHQFFPMDMILNGTKVATYQWFICCNRLATLAADHCYPPLNWRGFYSRSRFGEHQDDRLVLSKAAVGPHHAWVEKFLGELFFSDAFAKRLLALNLRGLRVEG